MEDAIDHPDVLLRIDWLVSDPGLAGEDLVDIGPVRTEDRIGFNQGTQGGDDMVLAEPLKAKIRRLTTAVTHNEDSNLIRATPPGFDRRAGHSR